MAGTGSNVVTLGDQRVRRTCMVVLGMHRSGTSAVTRVANLLGWDLPRDVMAASEGNHFGHWEPNVVVTLNDQLLASAGSSWHDWQAIATTWLESDFRGHFVAKATEVLSTEYVDSPLFVLKDPRICRLAPLWFEAIEAAGARVVVAIPIRNPIEVAESLASRDGIERGYALLVWLRNVLEAEKSSRGIPRCIFSYEDLLTDWTSFANKFSVRTGITWPRQTIQSASEIEKFLDKSGRHQVISDEEALGSGSPLWVREVYSILKRWSQDKELSDDYLTLDRILGEFNSSSTTFAQLFLQGTGSGLGVGEAERQRKALAEQAAQYAAEVQHLRHGSDVGMAELTAQKLALDKNLMELTSALAQKDQELAAVCARLEDAAAVNLQELDQLHRRDAELSEYVAQVENDRQAIADELQLRERLLEEHDATIARISSTLDAAEADILEKSGLIVELKGQIASGLIALQQMEEQALANGQAFETSVNEHKITLAGMSADLTAAQAELVEKRDLVAGLEAQVAAGLSSIQQLEEQLSFATSSLRQREEEVAQTFADLSVERRSVEAMQAELDRRINVEADFLERMARSEEHLRELTRVLIESEKQAFEFRWQANEAQMELTRAQSASIRDQDTVIAVSERNANFERENIELRNRIANHAREINKLVSIHSRLEAKIEAYEQLSVFSSVETSSSRKLEAQLESANARVVAETDRNAKITAELAKLSQLAIADAALADRERTKLTSEIDRLTQLANSGTGQAQDGRSEVHWLSQLRAYETTQPKWWSLLPASERRRRFLQRLKARGHFDYEAYNSRYPDVAAAGLDPLEHYVRHGIFEGRSW